MKKYGIKSVAEAAGVSIGTVSRILNPGPSGTIKVSPQTREKVLSAARKLNYQPSYSARLLRGTSTRTIGFALSLPQTHDASFLSNYTARLLNGIGQEASKNGYQILLIHGEDYRHYMDVKRIDALIMTGFQLADNPLEDDMRKMLDHFRSREYPCVVINNRLPEDVAATIAIDNEAAMSQIASLIVRKKFETIGFIGELTPNPQQHHTDRINYLKKYLAGTTCDFNDKFILNGSGNGVPEIPRTGAYNHDDGKAGFRYLMRNNLLPRCLVCGNDNIALGVMKAAFEHRLRIPEDLAVVGFDDDFNVDYMNPPLTTIRQPLEEFGKEAVRFLLEKLKDPERTLSLLKEPQLIEREST